MDAIMEIVFYKIDKLYKVLYISPLPQIAKFVNPTVHVQIISITEYASALHIKYPAVAKFVNPDDTETVYVQIISITECVS